MHTVTRRDEQGDTGHRGKQVTAVFIVFILKCFIHRDNALFIPFPDIFITCI